MTRLLLITTCLLSLLLLATAGAAEPSDWVGEWSQDWRRNPDGGYASFTLFDPSDGSFDVRFDEGLGIRGRSESGRGTLAGDVVTVTLSSCTATLQLVDAPKAVDRTVRATTDCVYTEGPEPATLLLLPADKARFFTTSFDCTLASTPIETMICERGGVAAVDVALAEVYTAARAAASREEATALRDAQRKWIGERDAACTVEGRADVSCLLRSYSRRILALRQPSGVDRLTFAEISRLHGASAGRALRDPTVSAYLQGHAGSVYVDSYTLDATATPHALSFQGCSEGGPGYDPLNMDCAQSLFVVIGADDTLWVARREAHSAGDFAVAGPVGQTEAHVPPSVTAWMSAEAARHEADGVNVEFSAVFP